MLTQVFTFLSIATTGMVAQASCQQRPKAVARVLHNAFCVALLCGASASLLLRLVGESLLNSMASGELAAAGLPYLHIRSVAVPAVLCCMVAQGACIGRQVCV
jgi:Na+-driven multidrug efflux pump